MQPVEEVVESAVKRPDTMDQQASTMEVQTKGTLALELEGKEIRVDGRLIRIASLDGEGYQFLEDPERAVGALRKSGIRIDLLTFIQKLSDTLPKYVYPMELDNMAVLRISTFDHWMTHQIDFKVRNKVRKAAKSGVVVREVPFDDALIRGISNIYNESPIRQGRRFWHYGKDLQTLHRMKATFRDRSIFIGAFFQNELIGFVKLVTDKEQSQAGLMHIFSMIRHREKAPTNALIAQAVRSCADRGISYLWYANFSYGKKQGDGLADFKKYNGFQKISLPRYYVPITFAGRMALRLDLHHSFADRIPGPVSAVYRRVRRFWYARRFPNLENA